MRESAFKSVKHGVSPHEAYAATRVGASQAEIPVLTGLRGVAALLVFAYHLPWLAGIRDLKSLPYGAWTAGADAGVGLFFCLSAYLLSRPLWQMLLQERLDDRHLERFLLRRAVRIFPAYIFVVLWSLLPDDRTFTFWGLVNLIAHGLALQTYYHQNFVWMINNVLWTVSIEVQFYLFLALAFGIATRVPLLIRGSGGMLLLALAVAMLGADSLSRAIIATLAPLLPNPIFGGGDPASLVYTWNIGYFLKWFLPGIVAAWVSVQDGSVLSEASLRGMLVPMWVLDFAVVVLIATTISFIAISTEGNWRTPAPAGWPVNAVVFAALLLLSPYSRIGNFLFGGAFLAWMGTISYGLYLWHYPILRAIGKAEIIRGLEGWAAVACVGVAGLVASVMAAAASWYLLERPAMLLAGSCNSFRDLATRLRGGSRR
jgi:peptidoglycan/LPS O-acetylase OafA/YrhL